ncbi:MAG: hypothetical protein AAFS03_01170 [Pseudomonadota bacterium]
MSEDKTSSDPGATQRKLGLVGVAGFVTAACAAAWMAGDQKPEPAQPSSGAVSTSSDHFTTPLATDADQASERIAPAMAGTADHADFIVKFEDAPALTEAARLFRKDKARAREIFRALAKDLSGLEQFELVGGSYSGELILRRAFLDGEPRGRAAVNMVLEELRARNDVAYCDPDFTAQPGQGD